MKQFMRAMGLVLLWAVSASAITIDGVVDAEYGTHVAVQGTPTQFGNNSSELNAAYASLDGSGNLSLIFTGNVEANGNGLVLFIDSRVGGGVVSSLGDNSGVLGSLAGAKTDDWGTDVDGGAPVSPTAGGGSILDPGFNPDMALTFANTGDSGGTYYMNVIDLTQPNDDVHPDKDVYHDYYNANNGTPVVHTYTRTDTDVARGHNGTLTHALNNTNVDGVTDTDASGALTATTGFEITLSAEFLGNVGQPIRILPFITNGDGGFLANQFLAESGIGNVGNLGGAGGTGGTPLFDAREFAGNQFIAINTSALYGDYNDDGSVNDADYVIWRKVNGTPVEYELWRSNYGNPPIVDGSLGPGSVPEPAAVTLLLVALLSVGFVRRKR